MRNAGLRRVLNLIAVLKDGRHTLPELAQRFNVSERTIRRDLIALQEVGVPVCRTPDSDDGPRGVWWIRDATPEAGPR